jgi:hypothetical protein
MWLGNLAFSVATQVLSVVLKRSGVLKKILVNVSPFYTADKKADKEADARS